MLKKRSSQFHQLYNEEWEKLPIFQGWLSPVKTSKFKAFCKYCKKEFRAHRTDLRTHAHSRKHQKSADAYYENEENLITLKHLPATKPIGLQATSLRSDDSQTTSRDEVEAGNQNKDCPQLMDEDCLDDCDDPLLITGLQQNIESDHQHYSATLGKVAIFQVNPLGHHEEVEAHSSALEDDIAKENDDSMAIAKENDDSIAIPKENDDSMVIAKEGDDSMAIPKECDDSLAIATEGDDSMFIAKESEDSTANIISTQVQDMIKGLPVDRLVVYLYLFKCDQWVKLGKGTTEKDGSCSKFISVQESEDIIVPGHYKLRFETKMYFTLNLEESLFPFIEVPFDVCDLTEEHKINLLLSPYGYMVFRGS